MVEKKEGAVMVCTSCQTELICRLKVYPAKGDYPEKKVLQWQNIDGSPHYSTTDGKNFTCNLPDDIPATPEESKVTLESLAHEIETIKEMVSAIFHVMVENQLGKKN